MFNEKIDYVMGKDSKVLNSRVSLTVIALHLLLANSTTSLRFSNIIEHLEVVSLCSLYCMKTEFDLIKEINTFFITISVSDSGKMALC